MRRFALVAALAATLSSVSPAQAYVTDGLYLYMDARVSDSYSSGNPTEWNDISPNSRNGTIFGSVTPDDRDSLFFNGTGYGTNYVDLSGDFDDWGDGFTVEFVGAFGSDVNSWERIFDFGNGPGSDNVWVGRFVNTQELALEIWVEGSNQGRCHTTSGQLATTELAHWVITMDTSRLCRIYKDGVEQPTQLQDGNGNDLGSESASGTVYPALPRTITRTNNYVGRSNWSADPDFEGFIQMIRIYERALTPEEVFGNATEPVDEGTGGGGIDESGSSTGTLASTGFEPLALGLTALGLVALGLTAGGVLLLRRRSRTL